MAATAEQYRQRLAQEQARYGRGSNAANESARDAAVRATNQALGYGNSTAMQKFAPAAPAKKAAPAAAGKKTSPMKTSSTGSPYNLPQNMTSPSAAPGFYTGADPGLTQSPTSVAQPSLGPTTQPQPSLGPTTQGGFYPTPFVPTPASVGLGMQPRTISTGGFGPGGPQNPTPFFSPGFGAGGPQNPTPPRSSILVGAPRPPGAPTLLGAPNPWLS